MVWNDAQNQLECTMLGMEVGRTSKGLVGMRPITIVVTIGSIYGESRCYRGSNILKTSEYTRPVRLSVWRIRLGRRDSKSKISDKNV